MMPCAGENKSFIISLSEDIYIERFEFLNEEQYSSNLKYFKVCIFNYYSQQLYGSLKYPTENWHRLGNFKADNIKEKQAFTIPDPQFIRFLKFNESSHFGSEEYCTITQILYFIILYFIFFSIKGSTLAQRTPERLKYDSIENHLVSDEKGSLNRDYFMVPVSQSFWSVIPLAYEEGENLESLEVMRLGNNLIFAELYEKLKDITESQKVYNEELAHTSTSYHESLFKIVNYTETLQPKFIFLLEK